MKNTKVFLFIICVFVLAGCGGTPKDSEIILYTSAETKNDHKQESDKIRVAIASVISPKASLEKYNYLIQYLGEQMNREIEIVQKQTYKEVNDMLESGEVDIAFICSLSYVIGMQEEYLVDIASPIVEGRPIYRSYTIVRKDKSFEDLIDLQGKKFAFMDPFSYSGRLAILRSLEDMGFKAEDFFDEIYYTYSHDYSVKAVSLGIVDGATVDSILFDQLEKTAPELANQIKVIGIGEEAGTPPIVGSKHAEPEVVKTFTSLLQNLHTSEEGQNILKDIGVDRYGPIQIKDYDVIKKSLYLLGEVS